MKPRVSLFCLLLIGGCSYWPFADDDKRDVAVSAEQTGGPSDTSTDLDTEALRELSEDERKAQLDLTLDQYLERPTPASQTRLNALFLAFSDTPASTLMLITGLAALLEHDAGIPSQPRTFLDQQLNWLTRHRMLLSQVADHENQLRTARSHMRRLGADLKSSHARIEQLEQALKQSLEQLEALKSIETDNGGTP